MGNGLCSADVGFPPSAAVIGVRCQCTQVIAIDVKRLDALVVQVRNQRLSQGRFAMAGLSCEPIDHDFKGLTDESRSDREVAVGIDEDKGTGGAVAPVVVYEERGGGTQLDACDVVHPNVCVALIAV